jgi:predicted MarR family transcription regulator
VLSVRMSDREKSFKELCSILRNSDDVTIFISATFLLKHKLA